MDPRFSVGTPRINDGQLLFLLHMISKIKHDTPLGTRIASVHNGSALFTGDAGSGESEIRKYIIENDYLEGIVALPKDMFYNTGIGTYIWILTNRKPKHKQGKVQLINAVGDEFFAKMTKSLGSKRNELKAEHITKIYELFDKFDDGKYSKIFDNTDFGFTQIIVDRPKRNNNLSSSLPLEKGSNPRFGGYNSPLESQVQFGSPERPMGHEGWQSKTDGVDFGEIIRDKKGNPVADPALRDKENIPLKQDIQEYFQKEVLPFAPDAFYSLDTAKVGYEINFNKYFYEYTPPRSLEEITADIIRLEAKTDGVLKEIIMNR